MIYAVGVINIAIIIGMVMLLVPAGVGLRESVSVILLNNYIPVDIAIFISICFRLFATLNELLIFIVLHFISVKKKSPFVSRLPYWIFPES